MCGGDGVVAAFGAGLMAWPCPEGDVHDVQVAGLVPLAAAIARLGARPGRMGARADACRPHRVTIQRAGCGPIRPEYRRTTVFLRTRPTVSCLGVTLTQAPERRSASVSRAGLGF